MIDRNGLSGYRYIGDKMDRDNFLAGSSLRASSAGRFDLSLPPSNYRLCRRGAVTRQIGWGFG